MNTKGSAFELASKSIFFLIAGIIITMVLLVFFLTLGSYKSNLISIAPEIQTELISLRFTNSQDCFAYQDQSTNRVQPGIIDFTKFNQETINKCYFTDPERGIKEFNFKFKLERSGQEVITNNYFKNENDKLTLFKEVVVRYKGVLSKDRLIIYVQEKI